jgi:hypothetical protein
LNPSAFAPPASCLTPNPADCRNGTSSRNGIRGFGFWEADASVRRLFPITERVKTEFRADFFNILNHPNWSNPNGSLGIIFDTTFFPFFQPGDKIPSGSLLAYSVGGGLVPLYQQGNSRSIQLSLKVSF